VGKKSDTALEILKYNPNVNATLMDGSTALQIALCNQDVELVRALLAVPDIDVNLCRHPEEVRWPLALSRCVLVFTINCFVTKVQNISPIHNAAELGNLQIVQMLLEKKADFNIQTSEGETPLMCACRTGYVEVVKELLLAGADPNIRAALGTTALHVAVSGKFPEIVRTLLERKVNVDVQRDTDEVKGVSPLHLAAELGDLEITKLLLDAGANINITYESGQVRKNYLSIACYITSPRSTYH
jgi:ankyrin repeat protein